MRGVGEDRGDPLGAGLVAGARGQQADDGLGVERATRQVGPDRRGREDRAQVADRVAPALVELAGLDDDVGQGRRPAIGR